MNNLEKCREKCFKFGNTHHRTFITCKRVRYINLLRNFYWKKINVSEFFIGLIVVGFGTSLCELVVSIDAVIKGSPDISVGNVIGSNIANLLLVLF